MALVEDEFHILLEGLNSTSLKLTLGILIFLIGFIIGKLAGRAFYKILREAEINAFLKSAAGLKINADHILSSALSYIIYFVSLVLALQQINLVNLVLYIFSVGILLALFISMFLAVRDIVPNFIAGIYLYSRDIKEGSVVEINEIKGKILHLDLLHIKIECKNKDILYIPNINVVRSRIKVKR
jgi:hypothetical protein